MSKLRGVKPTTVEKKLKALFYGSAGVGKTTAAINFPKPYLIDTEKGSINAQYVKILEKAGGIVFHTSEFDELLTEVKALLTEEHSYKTLIIDPLTTVYNDLLDKSAALLRAQSKEKDATGTEFGRHYSEANKKMKLLLGLLLRLDMNVIITSHSKNEYGQNLAVLGQTFDCYKKLDYLFDLVFEVQKRGGDRFGVVKKSRVETFPENDVFPFNYQEISKRYGADIIERKAHPEKLADATQVKTLKHLIDVMKVPEETIQKWLDKSQCEDLTDMPQVIAQKCIDHLNGQLVVL